MVITKQYDFLNRVTSISFAGPTTINSFNYQLNTANQRTAVTNALSIREQVSVLTIDTCGRR